MKEFSDMEGDTYKAVRRLRRQDGTDCRFIGVCAFPGAFFICRKSGLGGKGRGERMRQESGRHRDGTVKRLTGRNL